MLEMLNSVFFWIIAFFVSVVLLILMFVVLMLIKMKTHAFVELKAFMKKAPVSLFFEDGKFLDMKAVPVDAGIIDDKDYGAFVPHKMNSYLGKRTRNIYNVFDANFGFGVNVHSAKAAQELKNLGLDDMDYETLSGVLAKGDVNDSRIDCIKSNVNIGHLKYLYNYLEPHNIQASVQKKASQLAASQAKGGNPASLFWLFLGVFGAIIAAWILLRMFNLG